MSSPASWVLSLRLIHIVLLLAGPSDCLSYGAILMNRLVSPLAQPSLGADLTNTLDAANIPPDVKKPPVRNTRRFLVGSERPILQLAVAMQPRQEHVDAEERESRHQQAGQCPPCRHRAAQALHQ